MRYKLTVRHPEWLRHSEPQKCIDMYLGKRLPDSIAGWMIVVGLKHPLRAVYGSNLRAGWCILWDALKERADGLNVRYVWRPWQRLRFEFARLLYPAFCAAQRDATGVGIAMWGRHDDPEPLRCECGWGGMRRWTVHTYASVDEDEAEPTDECPACGQEI